MPTRTLGRRRLAGTRKPNGILPTLQAALTDKRLGAVWAAAHIGEVPPQPPPRSAAGPTLSLLPLPPDRWAGYFHHTCKETLWPAHMSQPGLIRHQTAHWADYEAVNTDFARHIASLAKQGATVWPHDYNLWLVPVLLKADRPDVTIGLFHHTPFPTPDTALPHPHDEGPQVVLSVETPRLAKAPVHKIRALDTLLTRWSSSSCAAGPTATRAPTVRPRAGVRLAEPACDPAHQALERLLPAGRV